MGEDDPHRGHLAHGRGRPAPRSPRPWARTIRAEVTSHMGEDDPRRGHLAHGRGRPALRSPRPWERTTRTEEKINVKFPKIIMKGDEKWKSPSRDESGPGKGPSQPRSPRPWARTTRNEVTSPMGEIDPRRGHLAHGRGRPMLRSPHPWARTTRAEVTSPMGEDDPHRGYLSHGRGPTSCPETLHPRLSSRSTILWPLDAIPIWKRIHGYYERRDTGPDERNVASAQKKSDEQGKLVASLAKQVETLTEKAKSKNPREATRTRIGRKLDFETPSDRGTRADKDSSSQNPDETVPPGAQPTAENLPPPAGSNEVGDFERIDMDISDQSDHSDGGADVHPRRTRS
ncbi:hypothetical protein F2Q69_00030889 [Brassica cretica]|uniref:Uncharacterized protein n=1 Tax=Brassica cretica TaxID=69181 RepID=A0A8S9SC48_BRACR|nr:hypothetical protein F2Q69_00030889 [Brassica cretica]